MQFCTYSHYVLGTMTVYNVAEYGSVPNRDGHEPPPTAAPFTLYHTPPGSSFSSDHQSGQELSLPFPISSGSQPLRQGGRMWIFLAQAMHGLL